MYDLNDVSPHAGEFAAAKAVSIDPDDAEQQFIDAMAARGLVPPKNGLVADGKPHRCDTLAKNGQSDGSYCLYMDGIPAGWFENHQDGRGVEKWCSKRQETMTPEELKHLKSIQRRQAKERKEQQEKEAAEAAERAHSIWEACPPASDGHPT
jgi:phage/plasmid primase-like uncharacterized protein